MAVEALKTKTREVVAVLAVFGVDVKMKNHAVKVVCLAMAATAAAAVSADV